MSTLRSFLTDDHRHCDDCLAEAETALAGKDTTRALTAFVEFRVAMDAHFAAEEEQLFPAFETRTGMRNGPTEVMRGEHAQMRQLMAAAVDALQAGEPGRFSDLVETLVVLMQQHNMKEENILYPMCDQHLNDQSAALQESMAARLHANSRA